jgi:hypothetical protein
VIEVSEDLSFRAQTLQYEVALVAARHELDRHFLFVLRIDSACTVHLAHAAVTDERDDFVWADALADPAVDAGEQGRTVDVRGRGSIDDGVGMIVRIEQRSDFRA